MSSPHRALTCDYIRTVLSLIPFFPLLLQQLFNVLQMPPLMDRYDPKHFEQGCFVQVLDSLKDFLSLGARHLHPQYFQRCQSIC
jgi:hypothetical protein